MEFKPSNRRTLISTLSVIVFLGVWEIAPRVGLVDRAFTSQPSRVIDAGVEIIRTGTFLNDVYVSLLEFAVGFALAMLIGVPMGLILGRFPVVRYLLDPPIMAIYATPHL